ncbi:NHLP leader peptide family RiPP precursor [Tistrella mobilis]|uniref:NHLP leader peptide family RiPP precursor n=1 Tax=Tistrella mobilis TaxID=171437 RepID=UPI0035576E6D
MLSRDDALTRILERVDADPEFRATMLRDPKAAISMLLGIELPAALDVVVHEETPSRLHIVLPPAGDALDDASLEAVSGGNVDWNNLHFPM